MPQWIMPVYIISGIVMFIGGYFSYKYKPCYLLESSEFESAIKLHRKKFREKELGIKETMTDEEQKQYTFFKHIDSMDYIWGSIVLGLSGLAHLFLLVVLSISSLHFASQMPLYYISGILLLIGFNGFVLGGINQLRGTDMTLATLDSFHAKINNQKLNKEDEKNIKNAKFEITRLIWQRNILFVGLWLHLIASLLHLSFIIIKN